MDLEEVLRRKFYREQLEEPADAAHSRLPISCDDMSDSEKISFIQFLVAESPKKDQQNGHLQQTIDAQGKRLSSMQLTLDKIESAQHATRYENIKLNAQLVLQSKNLKKLQSDSTTNSKALNKTLLEAAKYRGLYEVLRDEKFVGTSQKSGKSRPEAGRDDDKDDWTGTGNTGDKESIADTASVTHPETDKECATPTCSDSAMTYRTKDGRLVTCFYPMKKPAQGSVSETLSEDVYTDNAGAYDEEEQILKNFPGTHATVDMLVELVFNAYMLETPVYRDMIHLFELKFNVSRQTILNWLSKGSTALKKLLPVLKAQALVKDSIINCDETFDNPLPKGDLLTKALHYLKNAWTPVIAYRNDGRYCIDNSIAERSIRTLTIERKNKMAFGSHQGAETSTVYHTFMETCKMGALSFYKFLKNYLTAFMEGRTDFKNLPPAILGKIN